MRRFILCITLWVSQSCMAQDDWLSSRFAWVERALPKSLLINYDKSKITVGQDSHRSHQMQINKHFSPSFFIESKISLNKDKAGSGPLSQQLKQYQIEFVPRYQLSSKFSLGMGVHYYSSPTLTPSNEQRYELGSETLFMISGRMNGLVVGHWLELGIAKKSRRNASVTHYNNATTSGFNESQFQLKYQGSF